MKLLIIEDNPWLAESLERSLQSHYTIDTSATGSEGLDRASVVDYSAIILDLGLPDMNGLEVCAALRKRQINTPILILTAEKDPERCVALLDAGADDYVTKPCNRDELKARLKALTRRGFLKQSPQLRIRDLIIDLHRRQVERSGKKIALRRKEFDILEYLVANSGRVVTRQMIMNHAWNGEHDQWNNTVDVHIKHLRDKIDRPFDVPLIKTAYGIGYMVDDAKAESIH